jgi:hypothetical protein
MDPQQAFYKGEHFNPVKKVEAPRRKTFEEFLPQQKVLELCEVEHEQKEARLRHSIKKKARSFDRALWGMSRIG